MWTYQTMRKQMQLQIHLWNAARFLIAFQQSDDSWFNAVGERGGQLGEFGVYRRQPSAQGLQLREIRFNNTVAAVSAQYCGNGLHSGWLWVQQGTWVIDFEPLSISSFGADAESESKHGEFL